MKRTILSLVLVLALTLSLFAVCVSAEETKTSLIPAEGAEWVKTDHNDTTVTVEYKDNTVVFSGSVADAWPCVATTYAEPIVADVEDDYLSIDFVVADGSTNINFTFGDDSTFSISNTALVAACPDTNIDTGSGDIYTGEFKCNISIADLVASTQNLQNKAFPTSAVVDGKLTFKAIQVYSVNGAVVTINDLSVVNVTEDAPATSEPDEPSKDEPADKVVGNLVAGMKYTISEQFRMGGQEVSWGWDENAPVSYPDDNYDLTDGKIPTMTEKDDGSLTSYQDAAWMAFSQNTPAQKDRGYAYVQFDLGEATALSSTKIVTLKETGPGIQPAYQIEVLISEDGENYTLAGEYKPDAETHEALTNDTVHTLEIELEGTARYVEYRFVSYGWNFLGEIELLGETDAPVTSDAPTTSEPPKTGDAGILVFAVLAVIAIAGCATVVKARG